MLLNCGVGEDLRVPKTARSSQSILKEINPEYSFEGLILKLLHQLLQRANTLEKTQMLGKIEGRRRRGLEKVSFHFGPKERQRMRQLDAITDEFEQALGVGDGQESLVFYSPWVTESDTTERLNRTELNRISAIYSMPGTLLGTLCPGHHPKVYAFS